MKKRKALNTIATIIVTLGLFLIIGTLGAAELGNISTARAIIQCIISAGITFFGVRLFGATYNPDDYEEEN